MESDQLRRLPKMDRLLALPALEDAGLPRGVLRRAAEEELDELRRGDGGAPGMEVLAGAVLRRALRSMEPGLARVVNATGVVLHTNLGRAPLAESAVAAWAGAAGYCGLEYDLDTGRRGARGGAVSALLRTLTGAEDAAVVNNNAAAVLLALAALAAGKGVALSRGELVEIGGSFRMPDIMARSGAELVEVGTTNRTRPADYRAAAEAGKAQLFMKVHTSNYRVVGYTREVSLTELAGLGRAYGVPVLYDLGAGLLLPPRLLGLPEGAASVAESLRSGADLVCFSGDKLLGGPQAGILAGRRWAVEAVRNHPLFRALRPDKGTLAALDATLRLYQDPAEARRAVPVLAMLCADAGELAQRAEALAQDLRSACGARCAVAVESGESEAGGGALPGVSFPTFRVTLSPRDGTPEALEAALRAAPVPVVALLRRGKVALDVRTLRPGDEEAVCRAVSEGLL